MLKTNIVFNNKNYYIDNSVITQHLNALKSHFSSVMNGSGATINFGGTTYNIDSTKLEAAKRDLIANLSTVAGNGHKVIIDGVEYGIDSSKVQDAILEIEGIIVDSHGEEYIETSDFKVVAACDSIQEVTLTPPIGYLKDARRFLHDKAVVDIYFDGLLYHSLYGENGTFVGGVGIVYKTDDMYGDLTYSTKLDRKSKLLSIVINIPPLAADTVVTATYRYPLSSSVE